MFQFLFLATVVHAVHQTTTTYKLYQGANAWEGHGAVSLGDRIPHSTADSCLSTCTSNPECDCITWNGQDDRYDDLDYCYLRKDCVPKKFSTGEVYDTYMKQEVEWQLSGALNLSDNIFFDGSPTWANFTSQATSAVPVMSITASGSGIVGLTSSLGAGGLEKGFYVDLADGKILVNESVNDSFVLGVNVTQGNSITLRVAETQIWVDSPNGTNTSLGTALADDMYAKIVLQQSGASVEVKGCDVTLSLATTSSQPETESAPDQLSLSVTLYLMIALGSVALLSCLSFAFLYVLPLRLASRMEQLDLESGRPTAHVSGHQMLGVLACKSSKPCGAKDQDPAWAAIALSQLLGLRSKAQLKLGLGYGNATMHDVNREVIKPLCEFYHKSYAHILNSPHLVKLDVFISHAWLENFNKFVLSVDNAFCNWTVKPNVWICATALMQSDDPNVVALQVGTGDDPSRAPFTKALSQAEKLLVVRNDACDLYDRIWCCWELYHAYQLGLVHKPGALMVAGPSSAEGKLVDVAHASASNLQDKEHILSHILKQRETYAAINTALNEVKFFRPDQLSTRDEQSP